MIIVPTLQHGNAVHDASRRKRTQSVQTGMPTRSMGTMDVLWAPMIIVSTLQRGDAVHDAPRRKRTQSVRTGMPRGAWAR
ncbi:hypothetical protein K0038_03649 [Pseudomonas syringae]|nr:hypothetical protein [Pseudomonas syringae]